MIKVGDLFFFLGLGKVAPTKPCILTQEKRKGEEKG